LQNGLEHYAIREMGTSTIRDWRKKVTNRAKSTPTWPGPTIYGLRSGLDWLVLLVEKGPPEPRGTAGTYQNFSRASKDLFARFRRCRGRVTFCFSIGLILRAICTLSVSCGEQIKRRRGARRLKAPDYR
jgi:hypothetical protein